MIAITRLPLFRARHRLRLAALRVTLPPSLGCPRRCPSGIATASPRTAEGGGEEANVVSFLTPPERGSEGPGYARTKEPRSGKPDRAEGKENSRSAAFPNLP
jgi:hypothetical protein